MSRCRRTLHVPSRWRRGRPAVGVHCGPVIDVRREGLRPSRTLDVDHGADKESGKQTTRRGTLPRARWVGWLLVVPERVDVTATHVGTNGGRVIDGWRAGVRPSPSGEPPPRQPARNRVPLREFARIQMQPNPARASSPNVGAGLRPARTLDANHGDDKESGKQTTRRGTLPRARRVGWLLSCRSALMSRPRTWVPTVVLSSMYGGRTRRSAPTRSDVSVMCQNKRCVAHELRACSNVPLL